MLSLAIAGFAGDPSRVTEILGVQPTHEHRQNEISGKSGRPYRKSQWRLEVSGRLETFDDHHRALDALLLKFSGRGLQFAKMREEISPESVSIYGGFYIDPDSQNGIGLTSAQMATLVECQIEWGIDIFAR